MSETRRAFIAIEVPTADELCDVRHRLASMGKALKPVANEQLHLTLRFLGDVHDEWIPMVVDALDTAVRGRPPISVRIVGLNAFPRINRPSVVWAGVEDAAPLMEIAHLLETELRALGFAADPKPFHPHVTLARVRHRPSTELAELFAVHTSTEFGIVEVREVYLFESELRREGPRYTVLHSAELHAPENRNC